MEFTLTIDCDGAAFSPDPLPEIKRLLAVAHDKVHDGNRTGILLDDNGNRVGRFDLTVTEDDCQEHQDEAENICQNDETLLSLAEGGDVDELERIFRMWHAKGLFPDWVDPDKIDFDKLVEFLQD